MIIKRPLVTEKAITAQNNGKYVFVVDTDATKSQIASEFNKLFGVKALSINLVTVKGKIKTNWKTRAPVVHPNTKKAIITVNKDQKIDLLTLKNEK